MTILRSLLFIVALGLMLPAAAFAQISIPGSQNFDFDVDPGETYEGSVLVQNVSDRAQAVRVYQTDYAFTPDGEVYAAPGTAPRSNAGWVRFAPSALTLAPGESRPVQFALTIPEGAAPNGRLDGSFWSMLMIEAQPVEALTSADASADPAFRLNVVMRYGIQIATHVRGASESAVEFQDVQLSKHGPQTTRLTVDVGNTGARMTGPRAWVELFDRDGTQVARAEAPRYRIYPGTTVRYAFDLETLPAGEYQALIVLDAGDDELYAAQYTLSF